MGALFFISWKPMPVLGKALADILLFAGMLGAAEKNTAPSPGPASNGVSLPLELKRGHFIVEAVVHGSNSIWMMLDTGFTITTIDPKLAELLDLKRIGKTTIAGIAGQEKADVFEGPTFDFAGAN